MIRAQLHILPCTTCYIVAELSRLTLLQSASLLVSPGKQLDLLNTFSVWFRVLRFLVLSCPILFFPVLSCPVLSCAVPTSLSEKVAAFEYHRIQGLSADPPPGLKLLLVEPWVHRGILLLSSDNTTVLGGQVTAGAGRGKDGTGRHWLPQ